MMSRTALLLVIASAMTVPAGAASPSAQSQPSAKAAKEAPRAEKVVCRSINTTGSLIASDRVCKTRAEWDREADETARDIDQQTKRATGVRIDPSTGMPTPPH